MSAPQASARPQRSARSGGLDAIRGLFVILVLVLHAEIVSGLGRGSGIGFLNMIAGPVLMPVFFVLSGFLIAPSLAMPWTEYLSRRILRLLWPYAVWALVYIPFVVLVEQKTSWSAALVDAVIRPANLGPVWYLYFLALFLVIARLLARVPAGLTLAILLAGLAGWHLIAGKAPDALVNAPALWTGLMLANVRDRIGPLGATIHARVAAGAVIGILVLTPLWFQDSLRSNGLTAAWSVAAAALLVVVAGEVSPSTAPVQALLQAVGRDSMPLYLGHWPAMLVVMTLLGPRGAALYPLALFGIALAAGLATGYALMQAAGRFPAVRFMFEPPRHLTGMFRSPARKTSGGAG